MIEFLDFISIENVVIKQKLSEKFITDNIIADYNQQVIGAVFIYQKLSEEFCEKHCASFYLNHILEHQKLSEKFLYKHSENFNIGQFRIISKFQILSEDFIREFQNNICWHNISYHQKLSEDFIREFQNKLNWKFLGHNNLSSSFIKEFQYKIDKYYLLYTFNLSKDMIADLLPLDFFYINMLLSNHRLSKEVKDYCRMFI